jgi:thioredoxin-dependent peroxiredoxin
VAVQIGDIAPDFEQDTINGGIRFHEWMGRSWCILFSHPRDASPVAASELAAAAHLRPELSRRGIKLVGLSTDPSDGRGRRQKDLASAESWTPNFPVIVDADRSVSTLYGMGHPGTWLSPGMRCAFVIDPDKRIRLVRTYPEAAAFDFEEMMRMVEQLQGDGSTALCNQGVVP